MMHSDSNLVSAGEEAGYHEETTVLAGRKSNDFLKGQMLKSSLSR